MPKLSFENSVKQNNVNTNKCVNCIHCQTQTYEDSFGKTSVDYKCIPVEEYSTTQNAIDNCDTFIDYNKNPRDIFVTVVVYEFIPKFSYKDTGIGCLFRDFGGTDGDLLNILKKEDFIGEVRKKLNEVNLKEDSLLEPIICLERKYGTNVWLKISKIIPDDILNKIIYNLKEK